MPRLVLAGDSHLSRITKPRLERLRAQLPEFEIVNLAVGGYTAADVLQIADALRALAPDVLVVSVGSNDSAPWKLVQLDDFRVTFEDLLDRVAPRHLVLVGPPPVDETLLQREVDRTNAVLATYTQELRDLAGRRHGRFVDSGAVFGPWIEAGTSYHVEDGLHLNEDGYEAFVDAIAAVVVAAAG
jgi:lysophospholipase L1-like esterase